MLNEELDRESRQRHQMMIGFCACERPRSVPSWRKVAIQRVSQGVGTLRVGTLTQISTQPRRKLLASPFCPFSAGTKFPRPACYNNCTDY